MNYNWNWGVFWQPSPDGSGTYAETLMLGLKWTISTGLTAWVIALILGALIGTLRTLPNKLLVNIGNAYVELFRNIPLLVQMFLWFFVVPELLPKPVGDWLKQIPNSSFWTAIVALGFFTSARVAEQVKAGIESISRGQKMAGTALGMNQRQIYGYILLPIATRIVWPPLTSEFINVFKNSAVALTIGLMELTAQTRSMQEFSFQVFEAFTAATLIYLALNLCVVQGMRFLERKLAIPGFLGGKKQS